MNPVLHHLSIDLCSFVCFTIGLIGSNRIDSLHYILNSVII